eukprot:CAMPEP_0197461994 /NCGR_PEP_ID=MMETSP1175-20131217/57937_1 /TAXON_ID=1003142 /ORGANISM="Triceratium dubium, Strain CCMP147" /LENGTH=45 /DNA_ID= /DNA_START= /DNA_END= /DNA_ORIENTATION=
MDTKQVIVTQALYNRDLVELRRLFQQDGLDINSGYGSNGAGATPL